MLYNSLRSPLFYIVSFAGYLLLAFPCYSQTGFHLNTSESMNTLMLTSVLKDRSNHMWIASYNGLYKHEGVRLRRISKSGGDSRAVAGGEVHALFEDRDGFIWMGTTQGLDRVHPITYEVNHYPLQLTDATVGVMGMISCIFQDKEGLIWASTETALFRLNSQTGAYTLLPIRQDASGLPSPALSYKSAVAVDNGIWMHSRKGLVFYEYASRKFFHRYHNPARQAVFNLKGSGWGAQSDLRLDGKGNLWFISDTAHLVRYNLRSQAIDSFAFERPKGSWRCCYSLAVDHRGRVWTGFRYGGILVFDPETKSFQAITTASNSRLVQSNYIWSLEEDYQRRMWVATHNGLDIIDLDNNAVRRLLLTTEEAFRSTSYQLLTPATDGDSLLYLPYYRFGFMRVNLQTDSIHLFPVTKTYPSGTTYIIPQDATTVWTARDRRMLSYNMVKRAQVPSLAKNPLGDSVLTDAGDLVWHHKTDTSVIYLSDENVLYYRTTSGYRTTVKTADAKKPVCLSADRKNIWYLTERLNLVKRSLVTHDSIIVTMPAKLKALNISFSSPGNLLDDGESVWVTGRDGLLRYQPAADTVFVYTVSNGLSQAFSFSLCLDAQRNLWVGTLGGIDVYDRQKNEFRNIISYPTESGVDAFGEALPVKDKLCFISGNKLFIINPVKALAQQKADRYTLAMQEVRVNGEATDWLQSPLTNLSYTSNSLAFRFGLLDFTRQHNATYSYYLEGLENSWTENNTLGEVSYNSLPPGRYVFHLRSTDGRGVLLAQEMLFPFTIQPPFWQRWWARAVIILAIAALAYSLYKRRVGQIRKKAAVRQQLTELESKALRAQMNPHFIFNSLNAIQELVVTENITAAYDYLSKFSKLLRLVLNHSEQAVISLADELAMLNLYLELESLRFRQRFAYTISLHGGLDAEAVMIPPLLLQPFIENAIWHGLMLKEGDKHLLIHIRQQSQALVCTVEDNGIGRQRSAEIKAQKLGASHFESKGLKLSRQRIELLEAEGKRADIKIDDLYADGASAGTRVTINLPITYR